MMQIDLIILAAVGLVAITGGCYLLGEAKKYAKHRKGRSETPTDEQARQSTVTGENGTAHITPAGGNVFLDLGFPPEEAERLKAEADQRIDQEKPKH